MELDRVNGIQVKLMRKYCNGGEDEDIETCICWIRFYSEKFRAIVNSGIEVEEKIENLLYKE